MRIAIDARSLEGGRTGVGRYLANLLAVWAGTDTEFLLYFKDNVPADPLLGAGNFTCRRLKNPLGFSSNFVFQHLLLPYALRRDGADFFFSPFYLRPFFCPVKSAIVLHDISYEAHPEWFDRRSQFILRRLSKLSARKADVIFTVSAFSKGEIVRYYAVPETKVVVTPLAPDGSFRLLDAEAIARAKDGRGLERYLLGVGTLFSRRHAPEIIQAFEEYISQGGDCRLLFIGRDQTFPADHLDTRIREANARLGQERIIRLDGVAEAELRALYAGAEAVIYLSDYEGFGLPVVEAQFFGRAVITSANSSLLEVGEGAVEFTATNGTEDILRSLRKVLDDPAYRAQLAERGAANLGRFSWERSARRTLDEILSKIS